MDKKEVPLITAEKTAEKDVVLDPQGFFVIEVYDNAIHVEYYTNVMKEDRIVSGNLQKIFIGIKADALADTIATHVSMLRPEHYMYVGRELQKAQDALEQKKPYTQGGC
jgi:dihydropteroate synthase